MLVRPSPHTTRWGDMKEGDRSDAVCFSIETLPEPDDGGNSGGGAPARDPSKYDSDGEPHGKENFKECTGGRACNE